MREPEQKVDHYTASGYPVIIEKEIEVPLARSVISQSGESGDIPTTKIPVYKILFPEEKETDLLIVK